MPLRDQGWRRRACLAAVVPAVAAALVAVTGRGCARRTSFVPHFPQPPSAFGVASTSENCLYLNVYAPVGGRDLSVMAWLVLRVAGCVVLLK